MEAGKPGNPTLLTVELFQKALASEPWHLCPGTCSEDEDTLLLMLLLLYLRTPADATATVSEDTLLLLILHLISYVVRQADSTAGPLACVRQHPSSV